MHQKDLDQARAIARRLAERIRDDSAFREQVRANPDVLLREGLSEAVIADFLQNVELLDVSGYIGCSSISSI